MQSAILELEPNSLWRYFARLSQIPRCSKHEEQVLAWLRALAQEKGLPVRADAVGNLVMAVPASPGCEGAPTLVLQSHVDMVCEKHSHVDHDFRRDPIRLLVTGDRVTADGTTLGADNGIGMATALALIDADAGRHGPLELLFTVDEETGLTGASQIAPDLLTGALMINLDSEVVGQFTIGSAGGLDTRLHIPATWSALRDERVLRLRIGGLRGGHSGGDIHRQRASSIKLLGRLLGSALEGGVAGLRLGAIVGGSKRNAIPREAEAYLAVDPAEEAVLRTALTETALDIARLYSGSDPHIEIALTPSSSMPSGGRFCSPAEAHRFIALLGTLPYGVLAMSTQMTGLVETSSNVGVLYTDDAGFHLHCSTRSFTAEGIGEVAAQMRAAAALADAELAHDEGYAGWTPRLDSPLLGRVRTVYERLFTDEPEFIALHAGLECGLFMDKYPNMQIVSYGAKITDAHSPEEWVSIASVQKCWRFTLALVADIAQGSLGNHGARGS
jgi:dipeptidase D